MGVDKTGGKVRGRSSVSKRDRGRDEEKRNLLSTSLVYLGGNFESSPVSTGQL